jgi:DNA ligase-1
MRLLLGAKAESLHDIRLPCYASYKFDGWRAVWQGLEFFSRNGKTIPNRSLQSLAVQNVVPAGYDGELIVGEPNAPDVFNKTDRFCKTMKAVTPTEGVRFFVFDNAFLDNMSFERRHATLKDLPPLVTILKQHFITRLDELEAFENEAVLSGYEGIVTRCPHGRYKNGRSTMREQYLVKLKRYIEEEVCIIRAEEKLHNANPAFVSEIGYTKRSSHREGKIPAGTLGALVVEWRGAELRVGTGWDSRTARELWEIRDSLAGKLATIRFSPPTKDLPRQPVWKGLRSDL